MSTISQELRIIEPTEAIVVDHPIFLLFGQPGVGKTSLGFSAENAILLNFDTEAALARTVNRGRSLNILTLDALRAVQTDPSILDPFSTLVIDPVGACVDLMAAELVDTTPKYGRDGGLTRQGWGCLKQNFQRWMTRLRSMRKNILLIAHHKEDKAGDTVFVRPDIAGGSRETVLRLADFVGFLYMSGKHRTLDFNPTEAWFGKNPARWPAWKVPAPEEARTFMTQLFAKGRGALGKISDVSASAARQVDDWRADIGTYTSAEQCNRAIPQIQSLSATLKPQVAKLLMDHAAAKGIPFDPQTKVFVEPKPTVEQLVGSFV